MKEQTARFDGLLLVSDIDGTLTELSEIPQANIRAIHEFIEQGGVFTLCTGRPRCALRPILRQLAVNAPVITINGGCIYDTHTGEILSETLLPDHVRGFVFALLERFPQIGAMLVEPDNYWVIRWGDESIEGVAQRRDMYRREDCCRRYTEQDGPDAWHKVVLIIPPEQIPTVRAYIEACRPQGFYPVQSDEFYLELVADGVDKGKGMQMICDRLGLAATAAIGDRENDQPMLCRADFSAAPQNADENLKKEVDFICVSCENGAVADFIHQLEQAYVAGEHISGE